LGSSGGNLKTTLKLKFTIPSCAAQTAVALACTC